MIMMIIKMMDVGEDSDDIRNDDQYVFFRFVYLHNKYPNVKQLSWAIN
jgi:hypothetical protein